MRRTKEEPARTRRTIMDAALKTFSKQGIARTTMEDVARAAGVTRGAVYWHFANKRDLIHAIREEVSLPLIDQVDFTLLKQQDVPPLERVERFLVGLIEAVERCARTRTTFEVISFKCEYVDDMARDLREYARKNERLRETLTKVYREAQADMRPGLQPELAALETVTFLAGLLRLWLMDRHATAVRAHARELIAMHVASRKA
ncbi:MAG: TetR family transcriptional regulator [Burkholderiales bacterium]|nr:TetR family transcriptional regulator [Burkholderiales bacterium]